MVHFSFLGVLVATTATIGMAQECTLRCPIDAPCTIGQADFSGHAMELDNGNHMHCACPPGWTGVMCDHKYESCTESHQCYHGGECIMGLQDLYGNDQLFCDCSNAVAEDGTKFIGKYCETPFEKMCDSPDASGHTCVNGGDCNPNYAHTDAGPCLCQPGWEGIYCEFKTGSVPTCTLDCQNDGVCVVGVLTPDDTEHLQSVWGVDDVDDHMRCLCPPGVGGPLCESSSNDCGDDDQCYHGSSCVTTTVTSGLTTQTEYHCDCTTTEGPDPFAGQFCQFESTADCSDNNDNNANNLFCVNGGTCQDEDPTKGCQCPDGFTGFKCEYPQAAKGDKNPNNVAVAEECGDFYCFNGGKCQETDFTLEDGTQGVQMMCDCSDADDGTDLYAGPSCQYKSTSFCGSDDTTGVSFCVHGGTCRTANDGCDCPEGWTGTSCEVHTLAEKSPFEPICSTDSDCFHGGQCVETQVINQENNQLVESQFHCDCATAFDGDHLYAGDNCQFPSSILCTHAAEGDTLEGQLFCTNHGTCHTNVQQGCDCHDGFAGFHCEYETVTENPNAGDDDYADFDTCGGSGDLVCHNGGTCVTTIVTTPEEGEREEHYCDCSTAVTETTDTVDGTVYAGDSCQYEQSVFCTLPTEGMGLETSAFCVNGGLCRDHVLQGCDCPTGWTGFRCEYPEETEALTGDDDDLEDVVECGDNYCFNGGTCGEFQKMDENGFFVTLSECDCVSAFTDTELYAGLSCQYKSTSICTQPEDGGSLEGQMFCVNHATCRDNPLEGCDCPTGWAGTMCELEVEDDAHADQGDECGDGYCYNGGSCVTTKIIAEDGLESTEHYCDCSTAFDNNDLYAGDSCQYRSTSLCSLQTPGDSLEGVPFCVNYGACQAHLLQGCDCDPEWTGFRCEFATESEDIADQDDADDTVKECGDLVCLNGGACTTSIIVSQDGDRTETKHCDCAPAFTETDLYAGPQCEYKSTKFCTQPELGSDLAGVQFCVNGGTCNDHLLQGCDCPGAWTGFRCELQVDAEDLVDDTDDTVLVDDYEECGDDYCYNGGTCSPIEINGKTEYRCDCTNAITDTDLYAGRYCQYISTSLCTTPPEDDSLTGVEFCVNGGQCLDEGGCGCPTGYEGLLCEFSLYQGQDSEDNIAPNDGSQGDDNDDEYKCHLQCKNGGTCAKGAKDLGSLYDTVEQVHHLNQTYDDEFFEHCVCQDGWIGLLCEHVADVCGDNEHVCLHGSTCVKNNEEHGCDCSQADEHIGNADQPLFAGDSCQHPATDICVQGEDYPGRPLYFCVNQGKCKAYVTGEEDPPGCDCVDGWAGPHCEVRIQANNVPSNTRFVEKRGVEIFFLVLIAVAITVAVLVLCSYLLRTRSNDTDNSQTCMYFRRRRHTKLIHPDDEQRANLAPTRPSDSSPPHRSLFLSSSDPMIGMTLPPDDEPEPYQDEPTDEPYRDEPAEKPYVYRDEPEDEPYEDEPVLVHIGPPRDEDGHELHNVDFV